MSNKDVKDDYSYWSDGTSNKDDFTQSDKLLELKIIARERGIL